MSEKIQEALGGLLGAINESYEAKMEASLDKIQKSTTSMLRQFVAMSADDELRHSKAVSTVDGRMTEVLEQVRKLTEITPEIKVETNQSEVIAVIRETKDEILQQLNNLEQAINNRPTEYEFSFTRNEHGFLQSPIKVTAI